MAAEPSRNRDDSEIKHILFGGPLESEAGEKWDDVYSGIHQIIVAYGDDAIHSIHIQYDNDGIPYWVVRGEGSTGNKIGKVQLNYPREILTKISGHYDGYLRSLTFETNEKKYGPYGSERGNTFESPNGRKIVGFHGRSRPSYSHFYGIGVSLKIFHKSSRSRLFGGTLEGEAGKEWDDVYSGIHQIIVVYDGDGECGIDSIHILYDNNGSPLWVEYGGGSIGNKIGKIGKIRLNYPREILTKISGHYDTCLRSLTFESNEKKYGPYGRERRSTSERDNFESPNGDWKIVGFHGRSDSCFYSMGVSLSFFPKSLKPISVGPWGKSGLKWDDGVYSGIHQIIVVYGDGFIGSINIEYDNNGSPLWLEHGGSAGNKIEKIQLDYPREILTSISGHYNHGFLTSLTFGSNLKKKYGPYGSQQGTYFSLPTNDGKIVGFHGRRGQYLDSIGVYLSNLHTAAGPPKSLKPISVGPWGDQSGNMWDDGVNSDIHRIIIAHGDDGINSIKIEYDKDGSPSAQRGGSPPRQRGGSPPRQRGVSTGRKWKYINTITLKKEDPTEILTSINGYYDNYLRSLTFLTNKKEKKYGPYGRTEGTCFSFPNSDGKIVGFYGWSDEYYLRSIGVYLSNQHTVVPPEVSQSEEIEDGNENNDTVGSI